MLGMHVIFPGRANATATAAATCTAAASVAAAAATALCRRTTTRSKIYDVVSILGLFQGLS